MASPAVRRIMDDRRAEYEAKITTNATLVVKRAIFHAKSDLEREAFYARDKLRREAEAAAEIAAERAEEQKKIDAAAKKKAILDMARERARAIRTQMLAKMRKEQWIARGFVHMPPASTDPRVQEMEDAAMHGLDARWHRLWFTKSVGIPHWSASLNDPAVRVGRKSQTDREWEREWAEWPSQW